MTGPTAARPAEARAELRRQLIAAREALPPAEHRAQSRRIEAHLEGLLARLAPAVIGFCWPIRGEFDARPLVLRAIAAGARAALPVPAGERMSFRAWRADSPMATDRHGIACPAEGETLAPELVLMPLVGFDARGYRLGYGGGYFDRTLARCAPRPTAVGVGFELARIDDLGPAAWDIPCDYVVTEAGLWARRDGTLAAPD